MFSMILLAGGKGERIKKNIPKQFLHLAGKPIIMHIIERVDGIEEIYEIVIVCHVEYIVIVEDYIKTYNIKKKIKIIPGGNTRQESVLLGLKKCDCEEVIIHEAARPFVKKSDFIEIIEAKYKNVTYANKINYTVAGIFDNKINELIKRDSIVNIQLPQKFNKKELLETHLQAKKDDKSFTDDTSLMFYYKKNDIFIIKGKEYNIKITDPIDLLLGEIIYNEYFIMGE